MTTLTLNDLRHHALIVQTNEPRATLSIIETLLRVSFSHTAHSDIVFRTYALLGIEEVRELAFLSLKKPIAGTLLRIIVRADAVTAQAQNALLKQTEEPSEATQYIFVLPTRVPILDTLRSRCAFVVLDAPTGASKTDTLRTVASDLRTIAKIVKDKNDVAMETFLHETEVQLHRQKKYNTPVANALILARSYIETQGASSKMLLEHIALSYHEAKLQ